MKERVLSICGKFFNCEAVFLLVCIYDFCDFLFFFFFLLHGLGSG